MLTIDREGLRLLTCGGAPVELLYGSGQDAHRRVLVLDCERPPHILSYFADIMPGQLFVADGALWQRREDGQASAADGARPPAAFPNFALVFPVAASDPDDAAGPYHRGWQTIGDYKPHPGSVWTLRDGRRVVIATVASDGATVAAEEERDGAVWPVRLVLAELDGARPWGREVT